MWSRKNREQLVKLRAMLNDLVSLRSPGDGEEFGRRLDGCVEAAKLLNAPDGLIDFLWAECLEERG